MLWGVFFVVLNMVVKVDTFWGIQTMGNVVFSLVGVGFALTFIFANYEGSLKDSILESLKNIVSVLLGVVNVFSTGDESEKFTVVNGDILIAV